MKFTFGLEHEVAFLNTKGDFADFSNTSFADFDQIIQQLPIYDTDYPQLRVGDAGIKVKRWYIEGYERFLDSENVVGCLPKGIEIRTTLHPTIQSAIEELTEVTICCANRRNPTDSHRFASVSIPTRRPSNPTRR